MITLIKKILRRIYEIDIQFFATHPQNVKCNICLWAGKYFVDDDWHKQVVCPRCRSQVRHRLLLAALTFLPEWSFEKIMNDKRLLHFAPEEILSEILRKKAKEYVTADYLQKAVDLNLDITDMNIPDASFDLLIACDVLEHVGDDKKALREIHRVLSDTGIAIFTVPQKDALPQTLEYPAVTSPKDRERIFGQGDHLRIYGNDFPSVVETFGFKVTSIDKKCFDPEIVRQHTLFPPVLSKRDLATNYRKIFFARKHQP